MKSSAGIAGTLAQALVLGTIACGGSAGPLTPEPGAAAYSPPRR